MSPVTGMFLKQIKFRKEKEKKISASFTLGAPRRLNITEEFTSATVFPRGGETV